MYCNIFVSFHFILENLSMKETTINCSSQKSHRQHFIQGSLGQSFCFSCESRGVLLGRAWFLFCEPHTLPINEFPLLDSNKKYIEILLIGLFFGSFIFFVLNIIGFALKLFLSKLYTVFYSIV